ncbi:MAG: sugar ABC transporter permease [Anaerolineae bacterium]
MEFSLSLPSIRRTQSRLRRRQIRLGVALLAPALFLIILIVIYPTARSFVASVTEWDGLHPPEFNGLANFEKLLFKDELFGLALANSLKLGLISALGSVTIGYMLAELLYTTGATKGVLYRTVYFIPVMLPLAVVGVMFKFIYNPTYGLLNRFLEAVGLSSLTHAWLGEADIVLYSIIAVNIWKTFGLNVVLFFAGLQTIPYELYEAARIDGASRWQEVRHISLPMLRPVLELALVVSLTFGLKTFDLVYVMTMGGPGRATLTVPIWIWENSFRYNSFGYGSAIAVVFFLVGLALVLLTRWLVSGRAPALNE